MIEFFLTGCLVSSVNNPKLTDTLPAKKFWNRFPLRTYVLPCPGINRLTSCESLDPTGVRTMPLLIRLNQSRYSCRGCVCCDPELIISMAFAGISFAARYCNESDGLNPLCISRAWLSITILTSLFFLRFSFNSAQLFTSCGRAESAGNILKWPTFVVSSSPAIGVNHLSIFILFTESSMFTTLLCSVITA